MSSKHAYLIAAAAILCLGSVSFLFGVGASFHSDGAIKGSTLTGWHILGQADWKAVNELLANRLEPNAKLAGTARPMWVKGALGGGSPEELRNLEGELGLDKFAADVYGMQVGPTSLVVHAHDGKILVDPIDTTMNEGRLHLEPEIARGARGGAVLRLGSESSIKNARINDEVSLRVLSFVAPVLESATRVHGRVSVAVREAEFPLWIDRGGSQAKLEGSVGFQDVEFVPGPLANELFGLIGAERAPTLKLNDPISLTIADRKVQQDGFAIPLGQATKIELGGWVDFDRNLSLTASVPLTSAMVGNNPLLVGIVAFAGTASVVQQPTLSREDLVVAIDKFQLQRGTAIGNGIVVSLAELFPDAGIDLASMQYGREKPRGTSIDQAQAPGVAGTADCTTVNDVEAASERNEPSITNSSNA